MTNFMYTLAAEPAVPDTIRTYRYQDDIKHEQQVGETLPWCQKTSKVTLMRASSKRGSLLGVISRRTDHESYGVRLEPS